MRSSGAGGATAQTPPGLAEIEALAARAMQDIPELFKRELGPVVIRVDDFPDEETEAEMGLDSPFDLLGLYRGAPLPRRSVSDPRSAIDMIFLYRRPILDYWRGVPDGPASCRPESGTAIRRRSRSSAPAGFREPMG